MNCTRAEQLIPLHAGGDLSPVEADRLRQHVETCARCQQIAEEFAASQAWLSEFAVPAFDETVLADLRASVRREIEHKELAEERGRWFEWLLPQWNPRLAFAAVALILLAGLAAVAYRVKPSSREPVVAGGEQSKRSPAPPSPTPQREERQVVADHQPKHPRSRRSTPSPQQSAPDDVALAVEPPATNLTPQNSTDLAATTEPATNPGLAQAALEMLRIEFQTDDPNIRIIWFAPKSPKTEPNTK